VSQGAKQLTDPVAAARAAVEPRRAVGCSDPQCCAGVFKAGKLRIFPQACKHRSPGVGNDEFEGAIAGSVYVSS
jgi:hypothetical protein